MRWDKLTTMEYQYFIASRWRNKEIVEELTEKIRNKGKTVYCFLEEETNNSEIKITKEDLSPDDFMNKFESIPDWKNNPEVRKIFEIDMSALKNSEKLILLLPAGKSAHIEAGVAYGMGKTCIVIGEQTEAQSLYLIFNKFYNSIDDFISTLNH